MTAKTHVLGGMTLALGGFMYLDRSGLLLPDVNEALQMAIIMPYAIWSSTVPDLDQDKDSTAQNSPINFIIQKFFNLIGAGHRSFKSHIVPVIVSLLLYFAIAFNLICKSFNGTETTIVGLITLGLFLGLGSHMLLDMMTRQGLKLGNIILRVVPDMDMFGTGTFYESIVRRVLYVIAFMLIVILII